jgi:hypothetical protein
MPLITVGFTGRAQSGLEQRNLGGGRFATAGLRETGASSRHDLQTMNGLQQAPLFRPTKRGLFFLEP